MVRRWLAICLGVCAAVGAAAPAGYAQPLPPPPARAVGLPATAADSGLGQPLPADGLMAPPPAVPPRGAYRQPLPPPADPTEPPPTREPPDLILPEGAAIPLPATPGRFFRFVPRYGRLFSPSAENLTERLPDGTQRPLQRLVITGGVIVYVSPGPGQPEIEFATDDAVVWVHGRNVDNIAGGFEAGPDDKREVEVYLSGHVIVRTVSVGRGAQTGTMMQTLRANEVYYDVAHNRAIALGADLEMTSPQVPDGVHMIGREIRRLDRDNWEMLNGSVFSTKLPADPGLRIDMPRAALRDREVIRRNIFGIPYRDFEGRPVEGHERLLTVYNAITRADGVPVFYWPYLRTDLSEPLGPLVGLGGGFDRIFGAQIYTSWDVYKLLALRPPPGHKWRLNLDHLGDRGPAAGTDYYYTLQPRPETPISPGYGMLRLYGINDGGVDVIGGGRGPQPTHPALRGRALWRHQQELMEGMYFQGQVAAISDQNFLEQYYKQEFDYGPNQETFAYLTDQYRNLWASGLVQPKLGQNWMTRTEWLPRAEGAVVGQSFWDLFSYNARANAGYAMLRPSTVNPFPVLPTDRPDNTGRFDLNQEISAPFDLGPFKFAPYGILDLADYTRDLNGNNVGRVYGAGGLRGNLPFSRLYDGAASELFNIHGLYHKATLSGNYFYGRTNVPFSQLPQLDRLNDDNTDYTYRYIRPNQPNFVPGPAGLALATSPLFDQQLYAIRRLVDNRVDTLGNMNVLQMDLRQRFQTKRGYPGLEHTVDVFMLDLSGSYFPQPNRDNFGKSFAFLEYNAIWNPGDRTAVLSSGWFDPFDFGARYWNLGVSLDRPDRTNFYLGYRQTDPVNSKAVTASIGYQLSRRYSTSIGAAYDFGISRALTNSLNLTRTGSDVTITIGFTYNALVNNFGFNFLIVPNIITALAPGQFGALGGPQMFGR